MYTSTLIIISGNEAVDALANSVAGTVFTCPEPLRGTSRFAINQLVLCCMKTGHTTRGVAGQKMIMMVLQGSNL